jgi:hypothetical protein
MRDRCGNRRNTDYRYYGGRGVAVCDQWQDFANFWDDMGARPTPAHTLDRIDNDRGYEPDNCRWATQTEQARNRRNNRRLANGAMAAEAAEAEGLSRNAFYHRIYRGIPIETATSPDLPRRKERAGEAHGGNRHRGALSGCGRSDHELDGEGIRRGKRDDVQSRSRRDMETRSHAIRPHGS